MRKGYCSLPRWHTMLIARVLFFAISVVPSSSDNGIAVPRANEMLRQLERGYIRVLDSKSAKSKSSKVGLKSGSKGSKSKAAKSKSGKSKSAKAKSAKAKSAKAKSAKTMPLDAKIKSGKGKSESEKSFYSHKSEDSLETESSNDNEISSSDTETENIAAASTEMEVEGDPAHSSASGSVSSKEGVGIPRSEVTTSSSDGVRSNRTDVISVESEVVQEAAATANLEGGFSEERIEEDTNEDENHDNVEGDLKDRKFDSSNSSSQARIADISYYSFEEDQSPLDQVTMEATNLESESIETKKEKDASLEKLDQAEAVLDLSRESFE